MLNPLKKLIRSRFQDRNGDSILFDSVFVGWIDLKCTVVVAAAAVVVELVVDAVYLYLTTIETVMSTTEKTWKS